MCVYSDSVYVCVCVCALTVCACVCCDSVHVCVCVHGCRVVCAEPPANCPGGYCAVIVCGVSEEPPDLSFLATPPDGLSDTQRWTLMFVEIGGMQAKVAWNFVLSCKKKTKCGLLAGEAPRPGDRARVPVASGQCVGAGAAPGVLIPSLCVSGKGQMPSQRLVHVHRG